MFSKAINKEFLSVMYLSKSLRASNPYALDSVVWVIPTSVARGLVVVMRVTVQCSGVGRLTIQQVGW